MGCITAASSQTHLDFEESLAVITGSILEHNVESQAAICEVDVEETRVFVTPACFAVDVESDLLGGEAETGNA